MFRRRKERRDSETDSDFDGDVDGDLDSDVQDESEDDLDARSADRTDETADAAGQGAGDAAAGPFDATAPDDGLARVDLGGLQVPVLDGIELRVEVDDSGQVVAATLVDGPSMMQLGAFAAPKTTGIWPEVRDEIAESIRSGGGNVDEVDGPYGPELRTTVPTEVPGQLAPARFVGIDGPRWFLRALFSGPAGTDPDASEQLNNVLHGVVIVRGTDAMPIRDPLPLRLPDEAVAAAQAEADEDQQGPGIDPFERGPEITEVR